MPPRTFVVILVAAWASIALPPAGLGAERRPEPGASGAPPCARTRDCAPNQVCTSGTCAAPTIVVSWRSVTVEGREIVPVACTLDGRPCAEEELDWWRICARRPLPLGCGEEDARGAIHLSVDRSHKEGGRAAGFLIPALRAAMQALADRQRREGAASGRGFTGQVTLAVDPETPYRLVAAVVHSTGMAGFSDFRFADPERFLTAAPDIVVVAPTLAMGGCPEKVEPPEEERQEEREERRKDKPPGDRDPTPAADRDGGGRAAPASDFVRMIVVRDCGQPQLNLTLLLTGKAFQIRYDIDHYRDVLGDVDPIRKRPASPETGAPASFDFAALHGRLAALKALVPQESTINVGAELQTPWRDLSRTIATVSYRLAGTPFGTERELREAPLERDGDGRPVPLFPVVILVVAE